MSMLMTASLIVGSFASPLPEAEFEGRMSAALAELAMPIAVVEEITTEGVINAFDEESKSVTVVDEAGQTHAFTWDDSTAWLLNGEQVTRKEALVAGREAQVKHDADGFAKVVGVTTK